MARLNRDVVTTVIIDARAAKSGAEDFDRAAAKVASAANAMQRIIERQTAMLGEHGKQFARLKREIDPAGVALEKFAAKQKILDREFKNNTSNPEYIRLLGLLEAKYKVAGDAASAMALRSAEALDKIRAKYNPLFAATQRYKQELKDLLEAQQAGLVDEPDFRREHARIERDFNPVNINARRQAEETEKLAAEQRRAADEAAKLARQADVVRAKFDQDFAVTLRFRDALRELAEAERIGALQGAKLQTEIDRVFNTLHPSAVAAKKLADEQETLAAMQRLAAEEAAKEARALDVLRAKFDTTFAAELRYKDALKGLNDAALQGAVRGKPLADALDKIERELNPASIASARLAEEQKKLQDRAQRLREMLNPLEAAERHYNESVREAIELHNNHVIGFKTYNAAIAQATEKLHAARAASDDFTRSQREAARIAARRITQLSPQISDIVSQVTSGTNPLMILTQQGPQIADIFGGIPTLLKGIPPAAYAAAAAFVALGTAAYLTASRISEIAEQTRKLESIGRTINPQIQGMASHLRELTLAMTEKGVSRAEAIKSIEQIARSRLIQAQLYDDIANIAPDLNFALGTDTAGSVNELTKALSAGANGIRELDSRINFLTPDQMKLIDQWDRAGDRARAMGLALEALTAKYEGESRKIMSAWDRMTTSLGNAWSALWEKIANSPQAKAFMNDWANVADMITRSLRGTSDAGRAVTVTVGDASNRVNFLKTEAKALAAQIDAVTKQAEELQARSEKGVSGTGSVTITPVDTSAIDDLWVRAGELNEKLQKTKREIAQLEKPPTTVATQLTDEEKKRLQPFEDAQKRVTAIMRQQRVERGIQMAGEQAYAAALGRNATEAEALAMKEMAIADARRDLGVAIGDENELLDANIAKTDAMADAFARSTAEGLRATAMRQAYRDELTTGADAAERALRLLQQEASDAFVSVQQNFNKLKADVANSDIVVKGSRGSVADEMESRRRAEADAQFRDAIDRAEAAGNKQKKADLIALRAEYEKTLAARDRNAAMIAVENQLRRPLENELEMIRLEATLIGATNERREREIALLQLRQALVNQGYKGKELEDELARLGKIIEARTHLADQTQKNIEAFERERQAVLDAAGIMTDAFEDLIINGTSFSDVIGNLEKALLRLGTQVLVVEPLMRALREAMSSPGPSSGGGAQNALLNLGSTVMNAWSGWSAGTGPSQMPNAIGDPGALSGGALLKNYKMFPIAHEGWHVGHEPPPSVRAAPASLFVSAPRLHSGGMRPGEFPTILERGEEVLTARDPRHRRNFRGGAPTIVMHISTPDANSFRSSQQQVGATASRALQMAMRRNG